ncbi:hypothetical protein [Bacillus sp. AFS088145]|uniref:hypothetical protein n=1 Tax=Bacillus sp. AFS088145 TaxID=2033514 RepID=UPI000BF34837|nr:hypothetical protein [Bacillus sp. AFS088145]PFH83610.1 hypothetical protein COI44_17540 [Bacillus sp. AFS088145]
MKEYRIVNGKTVEIETRIYEGEVGTKENAWNGCNINLLNKIHAEKLKAKQPFQMNHYELERYMQLKELGL